MLLSIHALAGAALGSLVGAVPGQGLIAFGVGWASHYVLDSIPHREQIIPVKNVDHFETDDPAKDWPRSIFYQAVVDVLLAFGIIAYFYLSQENGDWNAPQVWGALGAMIPDLLGNSPYWNRKLAKIPLFKKENNFHRQIHVSKESQKKYGNTWGILTQLIVIFGAIWILW